MKKTTKGGKRIGCGRKKADYETKTIAFRVRVEFIEPIKKMVKDYVSERLKGYLPKNSNRSDKQKELKKRKGWK